MEVPPEGAIGSYKLVHLAVEVPPVQRPDLDVGEVATDIVPDGQDGPQIPHVAIDNQDLFDPALLIKASTDIVKKHGEGLGTKVEGPGKVVRLGDTGLNGGEHRNPRLFGDSLGDFIVDR